MNIGFKGKSYHLGTYESFEEAKKKRLEAEELIHNRFIKLYEEWEMKAKANPKWGSKNPLAINVKNENGLLYVEAS